jgi:hypothetical protein
VLAQIARLICGNVSPSNHGWITPNCKSNTITPIDFIAYIVDFCFLIFFLLEILVKFFGVGVVKYLRDALNSFDFVIIVLSLIMTSVVLALPDLLLSAKDVLAFTPLSRAAKVARLLRVVVVITRIQRSRERYRRNKMVGLAAPVEKVFEIITELRRKVAHPEDDKALAWTMDLIAKEELYKVSINDSKHSSMHLTAEMTDWLRSNLQSSLPSGLLKSGDSDGSKSRGMSVVGGGKGKADDEKKRRQSRFVSAAIPPWIEKSIADTSVSSVLAKMDSWDFDVFALNELTNGHGLVVGGIYLLQTMGVLDKIPIPKDKLANYLLNIERGYVATNPFHNAVHATDVMFTTMYFYKAPLLRDITGPLDKFSAVLAAVLHDFAHPGLSNPFLIATRAETAVLYNDQSVLEMFHIAGAFRVMFTTPGCDITEGMTRDQFRQFRETMISMVLATDLKVHFEHLGRVKTRVATDAYATVERKDVMLLMGQALHAADISNPTKPRGMQLRWTERVMKEFWLQGDKEASLGLPVSAFMDRRQPQVGTCQIGFINVLVKPLYVEWHKLLGDVTQNAMDCIEMSLKLWTEEGNGPAEGWQSEEFVR